MDFDDFFSDYIMQGLICGVIVAIVLMIACSLFWQLDTKPNRNFRNKIWQTIGPLNIEDKYEDSFRRGVKLIKKHLLNDLSIKDYRDGLKEIAEFDSVFYYEFYTKNYISLKKVLAKEVSYTVFLEKNMSWSVYLQYWAIIAYLIIGTCTAINCGQDLFYEDELSLLFDLPWREWWFYPLFSIMVIPYTVLILIEVIVILIKTCGHFFVFSFIFTKNGINKIQNYLAVCLTELLTPGYIKAQKEDSSTSITAIQKRKKNFADAFIEKRVEARQIIERAKVGIEDSKKNWVRFFLTGMEEHEKKLEHSVSRYYSSLSSLGDDVEYAQRGLAKAQKDLADWNESCCRKKYQTGIDVLQELEKILSHPKVITIKVEGNKLFIFTDAIFVEYMMRSFEVGSYFSIEIEMVDNYAFIHNLCSTHPKGHYHPYARDGSFCWGGLSESVSRSLIRKEYYVAFVHILKALQSADGDAPSRIKEWNGGKNEF